MDGSTGELRKTKPPAAAGSRVEGRNRPRTVQAPPGAEKDWDASREAWDLREAASRRWPAGRGAQPRRSRWRPVHQLSKSKLPARHGELAAPRIKASTARQPFRRLAASSSPGEPERPWAVPTSNRLVPNPLDPPRACLLARQAGPARLKLGSRPRDRAARCLKRGAGAASLTRSAPELHGGSSLSSNAWQR